VTDAREAGAARGTANAAGASLSDLLRRLVDDAIGLLRAELRLASVEFRSGAQAIMRALAVILAGTLLLTAALVCLLGALVAWLAQFVGIVLAALLVAAAMAVAGGLALASGIGIMRKIDLAPRRAATNLRRDVKVLTGD